MHSANMDKTETDNIAGIVLAGGKSVRMGQDKALLEFHGTKLLDHMIGILGQAGIDDIYVSGEYDGYKAIPDTYPGAGPAAALYDIMLRLKGKRGLLCVPVDMPLLRPEDLTCLLRCEDGAYYEDRHFPAFLPLPPPEGDFKGKAVLTLFDAARLRRIKVHEENAGRFVNVNTPEEWEKLAG